MKRYGILLLILLVPLVYPSHTVERPWNTFAWVKNNTYITTYGAYELWEANVFELSLESLALSNLTSFPFSEDTVEFEQLIQETQTARDEALRLRDACNREIAAAYLAHFFEVIVSTQIGTLKIIFNQLLLSTFFSWEEVPSCIAYSGAWRTTMDRAMDALEKTLAMEHTAYTEAGHAFSTLDDAGVCQSDYPGAARLSCLQAQSDWQTLRQEEPFLWDYLDLVRTENHNALPNGAAYAALVTALWEEGGWMDRLWQLASDSEETLERAQFEYRTLSDGTEQLRLSVDTRIAVLEGEQFDRIASSPFILQSIETGSERNVQLSWERIQDEYAETATLLSAAQRAYRYGQSDYLRDASVTLQTAAQNYARLLTEMQQLERDARQTVQEMREEARRQVVWVQTLRSQQAIGSEAESHLAAAMQALEQGDRATVMGAAYTFYRTAAREAMLARTIAEGFTLEERAALDAYENTIRDLLTRAEADGLDVRVEKSEFLLARGHREPWAFELLESIEASILEKAKLRYGPLEAQRQELFSILRLSPAFNGIAQKVESAEGDAVENGRIVYARGLGRLHSIEVAYADAEYQWMEEKDLVIEALLETDISWSVERPALDVPAAVRADAWAYNPTALAGDRIETTFTVPAIFALATTDLRSAVPHLQRIVHVRDTLRMLFSPFDAYGSHTLSFEKALVLARTLAREQHATGQPDGSAEILEEISFAMDYPHALAYSGHAVQIDGLPYRGRLLFEGTHHLEDQYTLYDAFEQWEDNYQTVRLGLDTRLDFDVFVRPAIELERTTLFLVLDEDSVSNTKVLSTTGEQIRKKEFLGNGMFRIELGGLRANRTARFHVSMEVRDASAYVQEQLFLLQNVSDPTVADFVQRARDALNRNDSEAALALTQQAQNEWQRSLRNTQRAQAEFDALAHSLQEELDALRSLQNLSVSHPLLDLLGARRMLLEESLALQPNETLAQANERLDRLDEDWSSKQLKQLVKDSYKEYADIREEFLQNGGNLSDPLFDAFEQDLRTLEVSNELRDLPAFLESYDALQRYVLETDSYQNTRLAALRDTFETYKAALTPSLARYRTEEREARNTHWQSLFTEDADTIAKALQDAETAAKRGDASALERLLPKLDDYRIRLDAALGLLQADANRKLQNAEKIYTEKNAQWSEQEQVKFADRLAKLRSLVTEGSYVKALKLYESFLEALPELQSEQNTLLLILGVSAVLVLALLVGYMLKQMRSGKPPPKWNKLPPLPKLEI